MGQILYFATVSSVSWTVEYKPYFPACIPAVRWCETFELSFIIIKDIFEVFNQRAKIVSKLAADDIQIIKK